ncbi:response regulator [Mariprofundus erugo]|uniref:response regulator n=1 Tax=Mariprofundus erugo TaxID=2528639 RepID=UPI001386C831|nr:response regulator transcription factor [Mariprofundus erugo]
MRVLILEDLRGARSWLRDAVHLAFPAAEVTEADCLRRAVDELNAHPFDLFLCDLGLPDGRSFELLANVAGCEGMTTVVTTIHDEDEYLFPALRAGIRGYILKDHSKEDIAEMLVKAVDGVPPISPMIARKVLAYFELPQESKQVRLAPREEEVLGLVARGFSIAETAHLMGISPHTVNAYLKECYKKLKISSRSEATIEALRRGLIKF